MHVDAVVKNIPFKIHIFQIIYPVIFLTAIIYHAVPWAAIKSLRLQSDRANHLSAHFPSVQADCSNHLPCHFPGYELIIQNHVPCHSLDVLDHLIIYPAISPDCDHSNHLPFHLPSCNQIVQINVPVTSRPALRSFRSCLP